MRTALGAIVLLISITGCNKPAIDGQEIVYTSVRPQPRFPISDVSPGSLVSIGMPANEVRALLSTKYRRTSNPELEAGGNWCEFYEYQEDGKDLFLQVDYMNFEVRRFKAIESFPCEVF